MERTVDWSPNARQIPQDATTFEANGRTYHRALSISGKRYAIMEQLNIELGYGRTPKEFFEAHSKLYAMLNKQQFADAAVECHYTMTGIARIADQGEITKRTHPALKLCTLFWNYQGENVKDITDEQMAEKLTDWEEEGIDVGFFFGQALSVVPGLLGAYRALSQPSSEGRAPSGEGSNPSQGQPSAPN